MFDTNLEVCGACGVTKQHHRETCDPTALERVSQLEGHLDRELDALLKPATLA
ncbi:hypothetical protein [Amycolatopsis alba]|uniref:hypothetical protein n=1 Tax=Amycolatopsis alba TaxID=76020 RepID=UPI00039E0E9F|nr:hypothetical protein [Amycolatopsis alba]